MNKEEMNLQHPNEEENASAASDGLPAHYAELKKAAGRSADWRARLAAVEELGHYPHRQVTDILKRLLENDPVYTVQEAAYRQLKTFGEQVSPPSKNRHEPFRGVSKIALRIKKSLPREHTYEEFRDKFRKMRIDVYDAFEGEKGEAFDEWLRGVWSNAK